MTNRHGMYDAPAGVRTKSHHFTCRRCGRPEEPKFGHWSHFAAAYPQFSGPGGVILVCTGPVGRIAP
jgi:hypothetical protein